MLRVNDTIDEKSRCEHILGGLKFSAYWVRQMIRKPQLMLNRRKLLGNIRSYMVIHNTAYHV